MKQEGHTKGTDVMKYLSNVVAVLAVVLMGSGCGTLPRDLGAFRPEQVMAINGKGDLLEPKGNWFCCETIYTSLWSMGRVKPVAEEAKYASDMALEIKTKLEGGSDVVVFLHGGLNTQIAAMERAKDILELNIPSTTNKDKPLHFVFVNWQSSLLSSYRDRLFSIREGKDFRVREKGKLVRVWLTAPLYFASDLLVSLSRLPVTLERQVCTWVTSWGSGDSEDLRIADTAFGMNVSADAGWDWAYQVPSALLSPVRAVTIPVVDALGTPAWDVMQRRTTVVLYRDRRPAKDMRRPEDRNGLPKWTGNQGPLYKLGKELAKHPPANPSGKLVLVGHSMGTILAAKFLRQFPDVHVDDIVFMAAACSVRDVVEDVIPYLADARNRKTRFYNLCLDPKAETRESSLYHFAPEGSLLVWLDQFLEKPDSLIDRMAGRYVNFGMNAYYVKQEIARLNPQTEMKDRIFGKVFPYRKDEEGGVDGMERKGWPMRHGDFGHFRFWESDFRDPDAMGPYPFIQQDVPYKPKAVPGEAAPPEQE